MISNCCFYYLVKTRFRKAVLAKTTQEKESLMEMLQYVFAFLAQSNVSADLSLPWFFSMSTKRFLS